MLDTTEIVKACFAGLLRRDPTEAEFDYVAGHLSAGTPLATILRHLSETPEFLTLTATAEFVAPGHFYSAIPSMKAREEFVRDWRRLRARAELPGITLDEPAMEAHFSRIVDAARERPFPIEKTEPWRYFFDNPAYAFGDGLSLYAMMLHLRPKRIIEVGSGYTSALMLDTDQYHFDGSIEFTFIEPYPDLLLSLMREDDRARCTLRSQSVQDIDASVFLALEANDILFIDSTHVAKLGSDVNYLLLEILPRLNAGVCVHMHDIFWPFEYPAHWIEQGRAWNEVYLLRALLQHNSRLKIMYFSDYVHRRQRERIARDAPLLGRDTGAHIWLRVRDEA